MGVAAAWWGGAIPGGRIRRREAAGERVEVPAVSVAQVAAARRACGYIAAWSCQAAVSIGDVVDAAVVGEQKVAAE